MSLNLKRYGSYDFDYLEEIISNFFTYSKLLFLELIESGNVNDTFVFKIIVNDTPSKYILQRINNDVFPRPDYVINNFLKINNHIKTKYINNNFSHISHNLRFPDLISTIDGDRLLHLDDDYWRCLSFISSASCYETIGGVDQAYQIGYGLGLFHYLLDDFPFSTLDITIDKFHNLPSYLLAFDKANNTLNSSQTHLLPLNKLSALKSNLDFVFSNRDRFFLNYEFIQSSGLRPRLIHGDPKISNFLIDDLSNKVSSVIDLDTVSYGLIQFDLADCIRSCCNKAGEEPSNIKDVFFDVSLFESLLRGYFTTNIKNLSVLDIDCIPLCIELIPFELGLRFLTDYIDSNSYFKVLYPCQNLDRACVQFELVQQIRSRQDKIMLIVKNLVKSI